MNTPHLEVSQEAGRDFFMRGISGPVTMLNLLRFKDIADYSESPELGPRTPISGARAFDLYIAHTLPFLQKSGGSLDLLADGGKWLIGPQDETWDCAMLVRQANVESFMAWNSDAEYLAGIGHRTAAISDSRLLPLVERN
ncbi:DUF1330 domain-containing protein [Pontixanthobacter gangjinensis]|uniref:DUF1330 domain-containing protein n=1 Tax=Pontixanthobacter gangjinensis TaxID=1028742 RepID=UPI00192570A1|nr:DUF1330 domain-containing protein [Pontixanthobacter gangjinensis]